MKLIGSISATPIIAHSVDLGIWWVVRPVTDMYRMFNRVSQSETLVHTIRDGVAKMATPNSVNRVDVVDQDNRWRGVWTGPWAPP